MLNLWFAQKYPSVTDWFKVIVFVAFVYALSPIDLIPDFIPVLGYLDDLIIFAVFVLLALKLIPTDVMYQAREKAVK